MNKYENEMQNKIEQDGIKLIKKTSYVSDNF